MRPFGLLLHQSRRHPPAARPEVHSSAYHCCPLCPPRSSDKFRTAILFCRIYKGDEAPVTWVGPDPCGSQWEGVECSPGMPSSVTVISHACASQSYAQADVCCRGESAKCCAPELAASPHAASGPASFVAEGILPCFIRSGTFGTQL